MKLRILSTDLELDNGQITNAGFIDAPSFHDFDIVLIDPLGLTKFFDKQSYKYKDNFRTIDYDSTGTNEWIKNVINQRRKETEHFLSLGRLLVCILRRPAIAFLCSVPNEWPKPKEEQNWVNNYGWFPLERKTDSMISILHLSEGSKINLCEPNHPFALYFKTFNKELRYEAHLNESQKPYYFKNFHIIAKTHGELPVAFSFELQGGQVVFLPPSDQPDAKKLAGVLIDCILANSGRIEESESPSWLQNYRASMPGMLELDTKEGKLEKELKRLQKELEIIQLQKTEKEKYFKLLYEQGKFQLEPVVRLAFSLLGFNVKEAEPSDGLLESDEGVALLEVEGKDDSAINIDKYSKLLNYVINDEQQIKQGRKQGILVGNGFRLTDPTERAKQFTREVVGASKSTGFCLITTQILFELVCKVLNEPDNDSLKQQIRKHILTTNGLFQLRNYSSRNEEEDRD